MSALEPVSPDLLRESQGDSICGRFLCGQRRVGTNYRSFLTAVSDETATITPVPDEEILALTPVAPEVLA